MLPWVELSKDEFRTCVRYFVFRTSVTLIWRKALHMYRIDIQQSFGSMANRGRKPEELQVSREQGAVEAAGLVTDR